MLKDPLAVSRGLRLVGVGVEQIGQMTRPRHQFNLPQIVIFAFLVIALIFFDQVKYLFFIIFADKLSDDFFCDIAADIFVVVAFTSNLLLLDCFEYAGGRGDDEGLGGLKQLWRFGLALPGD